MRLFLLIAFAFFAAYCNAQVIVTYAGSSVAGFGGDGAAATNAKLGEPTGVAMDKKGNLFIADQLEGRIRKVDHAGIITTVAGSGGPAGYNGDAMPATDALLNWPEGVAVDKTGNVYIADQNNQRIRKVDTSGIITSIAGMGSIGYAGDGGPATAAKLYNPADVAVDSAGNVYFVDQDNQAMRRISPAGIITTMAGNGTPGFSGDNGPATAAQLNFPQGIAVDSMGNIYIADFYNRRIRKVSAATGIITTVAGGGPGPYGDNGPATAAVISDASAVGIDHKGNIYIADFYSYVVRKVDTAGIITTIAGNRTEGYSGDCGPATLAQLSVLQGLTTDADGNVYIADFSNSRVREVTNGSPCTPAFVNNILEKDFRIFPNPSTGQFTLQNVNLPDENKIEVYNMIGEWVYEAKIYDKQTTIDLSYQPPGVYILYLGSAEKTIVRKLIILK